MYKYQNAWKPCIHHDSGSESAPLISSGSHISVEPVIFQDSETSDLEYIPTNSYFKYQLFCYSLINNISIYYKKSEILLFLLPYVIINITVNNNHLLFLYNNLI